MNKTVAILGGGPAGLSCALWLKQLGLAPVVLERSSQVGGIQRSSNYINNYYLGVAGRTGREVAEQFVQHAGAADLRVICEVRIESITKAGDGFALRAGGRLIEARALVVATGQRVCGPEAVSAIQADWSGLAKHVGFDPGQTPLLIEPVRGKVVAVVGGGDNAMSTAVMLGASATHIHLLSRRPLHGFQINQEAVRAMQESGRLTLHQPAAVAKYAFGSGTATFYVCSHCGVVPFVASDIDTHRYAVVNVNTFDSVDPSSLHRETARFDLEAPQERLARRQRHWIADVDIAAGSG